MNKFIPYIVSLSLGCVLFLSLLPEAEPIHSDGNLVTMLSFTMFSQHSLYTDAAKLNYLNAFPMWGARYGGMILTGKIWDWCWPFICNHSSTDGSNWTHFDGYKVPYFASVFASYNTIWFLLTCALVIFYQRENSPLIVCGIFAGLMMNFTFISTREFMPWDYPSLFFASWIVFLFMAGRHWLQLAAVILTGSFFKETLAVWSPLLLFVPGKDIRKRIMIFASVCFCCFLLRLVFVEFYPTIAGAPRPPLLCGQFKNSTTGMNQFQWFHNLKYLSPFKVNSFWFVNCGTSLLFLILPLRWELKLCGCLFLICMLFVGTFNEVREFYDTLTMGIVGLANWSQKYDRGRKTDSY